jgi:hypothetical protein
MAAAETQKTDRPERDRRPAEAPQSELERAHQFLDGIRVPHEGYDGARLTLEARLRFVFPQPPGTAERTGTTEERLAWLETYLMGVWGYIQDAERAGGARLRHLESAVNGLSLAQISAIPRDMIRL